MLIKEQLIGKRVWFSEPVPKSLQEELFDIGFKWVGTTGRNALDKKIESFYFYFENDEYIIRHSTDRSYFDYNTSHKLMSEEEFYEIIGSQTINKKESMLKEVLNKRFVNVSEVAEILEIGLATKKNVFLYGRGGHAKSEIVQEVLKAIDPNGEDSFVQACGEGLTEEKLFGGLNLKKFQRTGEIEYLVENSFMNKKYVVFEELLDSRMNVLLSLKDILTSGIFRQGTQQFKIKTEFVICLTNRTKQEVAEDNSVKALLERFPLEMKVEWDRYEKDNYSEMFRKVLGDDYHEVADICHAINETGDFISPRTAIHMAQVYKETSKFSDLRFFGATKEVVEKMERAVNERKQKAMVDTYINEVTAAWDCAEESDDMESYKAVIKTVKEVLLKASAHTYTDKAFTRFADLKNYAEEKIEIAKTNILNKMLEE